MTLGISNILNIPSDNSQAQAVKKNKAQGGEFVFEFQGQEYSYKSKAEYMEDIADGKLDAGNASFIGKIEKFAKDLPLIGGLFEAYDKKHEGEALKETEIANSQKESDAANQLTTSANHNIKNIDKNTDKADEKTSDDQKVIDEKNKEIDKLKAEIRELEKEEKAAKEEKIAQTVKKAEKEYNPEKHGSSREAFINKQLAGIMNTGKTKSAELKDQLKITETDVKDLLSDIANRNKINRQSDCAKLNMNIHNTLSTAATASEKNYQKQLVNLTA
ncbi:hypothetical protein IKA15_05165 [bacterium]|nr:hypothetical protein [bacterium]